MVEIISKIFIKAIFEIISIGVSNINIVILSKSRFHFKNDCMSCSFNEYNIDQSKLNEEKENDEEDQKYDDLPEDSFKTIVPPHPKYKESINCKYDLRTLKN